MVSKATGGLPGDPHYRAFVGPPEHYDVMGALQIGLLFALGLRETQTVCDVGCGSLRAGKLIMSYVEPGRYFGIDPERWVIEQGIHEELGAEFIAKRRPTFRYESDFSIGAFDTTFDFVLAQSIFSHTYADAASTLFEQTSSSLAPKGLLLGTMYELAESTAHLPDPRSSTGWSYPGNVAYSWDDFTEIGRDHGLCIEMLAWPHPRQQWFVACHEAVDAEVLADAHRRVAIGTPQFDYTRSKAG